MNALVRMRLGAFLRSGRVIAPILAGLIAIALAYGGGAAPAVEAYGFTAVVMFPVIAWQTKLLLDAEPDVQRRLARVALRSAGGELAAGLERRTGEPAAAGSSIGEVLDIPMTAHFLGGAVISDSPERGVIDPYHRVWGYPGLHVLDGAAVSANLGVNPSLTITALAEHAMSKIPPKQGAEQGNLPDAARPAAV